MNATTSLIQPEQVEQAILLIRGQRVMLDRDLAALYGVETKNLNKAVQRNLDRFPPDFMFQLTADEADGLRFQFGTLKLMPLENSRMRNMRSEFISRHCGTPLAQAADAHAFCPAKTSPSSTEIPASTPAATASPSASRFPERLR